MFRYKGHVLDLNAVSSSLGRCLELLLLLLQLVKMMLLLGLSLLKFETLRLERLIVILCNVWMIALENYGHGSGAHRLLMPGHCQIRVARTVAF